MGQYPDAAIDEIARSTTEGVVTSAILFETMGGELEANYDAAGEFLSLEDVLEENEIPAAVLNAIGNGRVLLSIVEFELVTTADEAVSHVVEYENKEGDSISFRVHDLSQLQRME